MERGGMVGASNGIQVLPNYILAAALIVLFRPLSCGPCTKPENSAPRPIKTEDDGAKHPLANLNRCDAKSEYHGASGTKSQNHNSLTGLDGREAHDETWCTAWSVNWYTIW